MELIKSLLSKLPLGKIKVALIVAAILFVAGLLITLRVTNRKYKEVCSDNERLTNNLISVMGKNLDYSKQIWRYKELNGELEDSIKVLADSLDVKPKQIIKVEYITVTEHDTVPKPVYTNPIQKNKWFVSDTGKCHLWEGIAKLDTTEYDLAVDRTLFEYNNKTTHTYYKKRPHKFLFIRFGKWQYLHSVKPTCGDSFIEEIEFIK